MVDFCLHVLLKIRIGKNKRLQLMLTKKLENSQESCSQCITNYGTYTKLLVFVEIPIVFTK